LSQRDPIVLEGDWRLHGVVDLIEAGVGTAALRVTDHKTGSNRTAAGLVVGGGETLQPVLYALAVESALGQPVSEARLSFCTSRGGFTDRAVPIGPRQRRSGIEVLEIINRALETVTLVPAPKEGACRWCDFASVCGPHEERRTAGKDPRVLRDLHSLRQMP
jgi:CRISPR/Cas system-associated exonuclease Cas4 (RecB family)